jgi:hypothetical protein
MYIVSGIPPYMRYVKNLAGKEDLRSLLRGLAPQKINPPTTVSAPPTLTVTGGLSSTEIDPPTIELL